MNRQLHTRCAGSLEPNDFSTESSKRIVLYRQGDQFEVTINDPKGSDRNERLIPGGVGRQVVPAEQEYGEQVDPLKEPVSPFSS